MHKLPSGMVNIEAVYLLPRVRTPNDFVPMLNNALDVWAGQTIRPRKPGGWVFGGDFVTCIDKVEAEPVIPPPVETPVETPVEQPAPVETTVTTKARKPKA